MRSNLPQIQLVVLDWAGTTVDYGCYAPVAAFVESLARFGIDVTPKQAREPMGLHKKDHLRALLSMETIASQWRVAHGRDWQESDVETLFNDQFVPLQLEVAVRHSRVVPGLLTCVDQLRTREIKLGTSTGYFRAAAEQVYATAQQQGYTPDWNVCADDVPSGRPAPWMIYRNMERLQVFPPHHVLKIGDTVPDIQEGRNAGVWSVGVTHTSSEVGCTEAEFAALDDQERERRVNAARQTLTDAGAHWVLDSVADLPDAIQRVDRQLQDGRRPSDESYSV